MEERETVQLIHEGIEQCVRALVSDANAVSVAYSLKEDKHSFTIATAKRDTGMVIGKRGANIQAIRQIYRSVATKNGILIEIEVDE